MKKTFNVVLKKNNRISLFSGTGYTAIHLLSNDKDIKKHKELVKKCKIFKKETGLNARAPEEVNKYLLSICNEGEIYFPNFKLKKKYKITIEEI